MNSVFQRALGTDYERLHPKLQLHYLPSSTDGVIGWGFGEVHIWRDRFSRQAVPFSLESRAFRDGHGREVLSMTSIFHFTRPRKVEASWTYDEFTGLTLEYPRLRGVLRATQTLSVDNRGGLRITTGSQRLCIGQWSFELPGPLRTEASVYEFYDEDDGCVRLDVDVTRPLSGDQYGYSGKYVADFR
ncbi:DUF4166 domain-containing protein [Pseudonocardiaceae bacterium YIM PH 21723]|nr:DUF4166 domain-containing protein [Pseudonocardiaceae bacterium YIM PH 21723]